MAGKTNRRKSTLTLDKNGKLRLQLVQAATGRDVVGMRLVLKDMQSPKEPTADEIEACTRILEATQRSSLTVMSYHPGIAGCSKVIEERARDRTIVGLAGVGSDVPRRNRALIATADGVHWPEKISLSSEDEDLDVQRGDELNLFVDPAPETPDAVRWAVLNCHEYSHVDLLRDIQKEKVEVLIVVTYNAATRLFWQYAIADVHRLFCYVIVANVAELGGSGVFAPFRRIGREKTAQLGAGGQVFGSKGAAEFAVSIDLEIGELRTLREEFARDGFLAPKLVKSRGSIYTPMVPSEHFMKTLDRGPGAPHFDDVIDVATKWNHIDPRVAIAQLKSMDYKAYYETRYRLRNHSTHTAFEDLLSFRLEELEKRCSGQKATSLGHMLDFLVLPEVFVPRSFLPVLQDFSNRLHCIVIAGVDYPDEDDANECAILRPATEPVFYRKLTRSQYDAKTDDEEGRFPMLRGTNLFRFRDEDGSGFGVLICYDFSHFDLMWNLNLLRRSTPLDITFIIAHNPFGDLYRSCCIADAHRFYQYVVMCNVSTFGGSGVFGPIRTEGARQVLIDAGKGVETIAVADLCVGELRKARSGQDRTLHEGEFMRRPGVFQSRWP